MEVSASNIDPKYVGELEATLGKFRMENANQNDTIGRLEDKVKASEQVCNQFRQELEALEKDRQELSTLRARCRELEVEREARNLELKVSQEVTLKLRQQVFASTVDTFAYESLSRDNANLREHQQQMAGVLEALRVQFAEYIALSGLSVDEVRAKEANLNSLEEVEQS